MIDRVFLINASGFSFANPSWPKVAIHTSPGSLGAVPAKGAGLLKTGILVAAPNPNTEVARNVLRD